VRSTGVNVRKEFVSPDLNAAVNITQCVALETRPAEPTRANFAGHPLPLDVYKQKLEPIAVGGRKGMGGVFEWFSIYPTRSWDIFCFTNIYVYWGIIASER